MNEKKKPIYLDYNATTPIAPQVAEAMQPYIFEHFGNPSSTHVFGTIAKKAVETARKQIASLLGCQADEIIFTSGGSESNNLGIKGIVLGNRNKGNHIISSAVEHPAVLDVLDYLEKQGFKITILPVDEFGMVNPEDLEKSILPSTVLITIMHANNEVGTIQPIRTCSDIAHKRGILFHTDAAQSIGKIPVRVADLGVDLLSIAGHKVYAPKGIGALYVRRGLNLQKQIHGAEHEMNIRAGTENVIEIVGLGKASELVENNLNDYADHMRKMRALLETRITQEFPEIKINGHPVQRLPNTLNVSFKGLEANTILSELANVAVSAGAACHADQVDVSPVIEAMGVPIDYAMGTIRFTTGRDTTEAEIERAVDEIKEVIRKLQPKTSVQLNSSSDEEIYLTQFTHGLGCACKLRPQLLEEVLADMTPPSDERILVGTETGDDAAVYLVDENTAIVQTVDFFTPIVDDPYDFGAISAANSLSDIYAMGSKPLFALNIVGFPSNRLPISVLKDILRGANDKAQEAGISVIGGHTVDDTEPKYGMAVTGIVHPEKIITNAGSKVGDVLIMTKRLGTGILTTAMKQRLLSKELSEAAINSMATLNSTAAEYFHQYKTHACTDITGFGFIGHLLGMMRASETPAEIHFDSIPFLSGVYELGASGVIPGGTKSNHSFTKPYVIYKDNLSNLQQLLLNDAQTSGGLIISVESSKANEYLQVLKENGVQAVIIGKVISKEDPNFIKVI